MTPVLDIPRTLQLLEAKRDAPFELGLACGRLLHSIPGIVATHLRHNADHHSTLRQLPTASNEFTEGVDRYLHSLRHNDSITKAFPEPLTYPVTELPDRKSEKRYRKYKLKYIGMLQEALRSAIFLQFRDVFSGYSVHSNQQFNNGVHSASNSFSWRLYPCVNVALEVGSGDWNSWLKVRCDELGMISSREGFCAIED